MHFWLRNNIFFSRTYKIRPCACTRDSRLHLCFFRACLPCSNVGLTVDNLDLWLHGWRVFDADPVRSRSFTKSKT